MRFSDSRFRTKACFFLSSRQLIVSERLAMSFLVAYGLLGEWIVQAGTLEHLRCLKNGSRISRNAKIKLGSAYNYMSSTDQTRLPRSFKQS
ncbi:hypothetical protein CPC08DRAFT_472857 [Agrocybe pediades]|nr:hypothetical protein CPC08DRAFT_472857 [Agrocybe pediades]